LIWHLLALFIYFKRETGESAYNVRPN
jgi:hypothetical protein